MVRDLEPIRALERELKRRGIDPETYATDILYGVRDKHGQLVEVNPLIPSEAFTALRNQSLVAAIVHYIENEQARWLVEQINRLEGFAMRIGNRQEPQEYVTEQVSQLRQVLEETRRTIVRHEIPCRLPQPVGIAPETQVAIEQAERAVREVREHLELGALTGRVVGPELFDVCPWCHTLEDHAVLDGRIVCPEIIEHRSGD